MERPAGDDREALELLLQRDDVAPHTAEFLESLDHWVGCWTPKQVSYFDDLCDRYLGGH